MVDDAILASVPLLPSLLAGNPDVQAGRKEYRAARDGVYLRAASRAMQITSRVAECALPYGPIESSIKLTNGPVPIALLHSFVAAAEADRHIEIAGVIETFNSGYRLRLLVPESATGASVTYDDDQVDDERLVIDLHSHGQHKAQFSSQDNDSDLSRRGPYLAMVVGECGVANLIAARVVAPPHLIDTSINSLIATGVLA